LGYALFLANAKKLVPALTEAELAEGRLQFDQKAQRAMSAVYQLLRALPAIPPTVEQILRRHEQLARSLMNSPGADTSGN
jgi:hypothetical protein